MQLSIPLDFDLIKKSVVYSLNKHNEQFNNFQIVKLHEYNLDKEINFKINKLPNLSSVRKGIDFKFINRFFKINYHIYLYIYYKKWVVVD